MMRWNVACSLVAVLVCVSGWADDPAAVAATKALEKGNANTPPHVIDKLFTDFCNTNFGAKKDDLVYKMFGRELKQIRSGSWIHVSQNSACVSWETNLPAKTYVEYGPTPNLGSNTEIPNRFHYIHVHYVKGLKANATYHYRLVSIDENGKKLVSPTTKLTTKAPANVAYIPGKLAGPPYMLDKANTTYVLTEDLVCDQSAIEIKAEGITLDLNGHTVVYHEKTTDKAIFTDKWMSYVRKGVFGVKNWGHKKFTLLNGTVYEGKGQNRGNGDSCGFNPIYIRDSQDVEIAGVTVDYHTPQSVGVRFRNSTGNFEVHHNVIYDRGTKMHNRHGGGCAALNAIRSQGTGYVWHHNLVKRTRQNGLRSAGVLYANEVYVDSWATNSFATGAKKEMYGNRIFCTGYHAISCPWGDGVKIHDNLVHMQGINTGKTRWWEGFGDQNSMNGLRHTQWGTNKTKSDNSHYYNNTVIVKGRHGSQMRGVEFFSDPYISNLTLENCTIKVEVQDQQTKKAACVVTHGLAKRRDSQKPVYYRNCTFISNINILRLGDDYGVGCNHTFINCKFVRIGKDPRFSTIRASGVWWSINHVLRDCTAKGGADLCQVDWGKTKPGSRNYYIQHTLTIKGKGGTAVRIDDLNGNPAFVGKIPESGKLQVGLNECKMSHAGKQMLTPHSVQIGAKTKKITMTSAKELQ